MYMSVLSFILVFIYTPNRACSYGFWRTKGLVKVSWQTTEGRTANGQTQNDSDDDGSDTTGQTDGQRTKKSTTGRTRRRSRELLYRDGGAIMYILIKLFIYIYMYICI